MMAAERILETLHILSCLIGFSTTCYTRRCLANEFIAKELFSPPQPPECAVMVNLTSIQYETLSVNTQTLRFSSRLKIEMQWRDPDLSWSDPQYDFDELMLPVDKIWTPDLTVDNSVLTEAKPVSDDILVRKDGTVQHTIQVYTTVVCEIKLFNYPFVKDSCPIGINGWTKSACGLRFRYGNVSLIGESRGEWQTVSVTLLGDSSRHDRNYLKVTMSINPFNTIVTLILPSILIMMADLVSFALPLEGGKRSAFKITLVLSFTMFLLILTDHLPDSGACSPLIRHHYCVCLIVLGLSLLTSMVFTRIATEGSIMSFRFLKACGRHKDKTKSDKTKDFNLNGVKNAPAVTTEESSIQRIVMFLDNIEQANKETKKKQQLANRLDKITFWIYFSADVGYAICMIVLSRTDLCNNMGNNMDFWF